MVELAKHSIHAITNQLGLRYSLQPQIAFESVTGTTRYIVDVVGTQFKVEFFRVGNDPHDRQRFERRQPVIWLNRQVWLPTAEDTSSRSCGGFRISDAIRTMTTFEMSFPSSAINSTGPTSNAGATSMAPAPFSTKSAQRSLRFESSWGKCSLAYPPGFFNARLCSTSTPPIEMTE